MRIRFILALAICTTVVGCSAGNFSEYNELSLVFYRDSLAIYRGTLNENTKISYCSFDTSTIENLIRKNIVGYKGQSILVVKPSPASDGNIADHLNLVKHISNALNLDNSITFTLTDNEKKHFKSDERINY